MARRRKVGAQSSTSEAKPNGSVIACGVVDGRAVPWKSPPLIFDRAKGKARVASWDSSYKRFSDWVHHIKRSAKRDVGPDFFAYHGPVRLELTFVLDGSGTTPDITNLQKAFEDALQEVVYANDRQVVSVQSNRVVSRGEQQRVEWRVVAQEQGRFFAGRDMASTKGAWVQNEQGADCYSIVHSDCSVVICWFTGV